MKGHVSAPLHVAIPVDMRQQEIFMVIPTEGTDRGRAADQATGPGTQ